MILKSVRLNNIRSFIDEKIEFPQGSVLLSGNVGAGKSTILLAVDFAFFGTRRGELSGSDLLRHGEDHGSVELAFEVDGKDAIIKRALKRGKGIVQDSGTMMIDNELVILPSPSYAFADDAATNDMTGFPDDSVCATDKLNDPDGTAYTVTTDGDGYILYGHDIIANAADAVADRINYSTTATTSYYYTCESNGSVRQWDGTDVTTATELST